MFTTVILNKKESNKIPQVATGKNGITCGNKGDWDNLFATFTDIEGNKYVALHGTKNGELIFPKNGMKFAICSYELYNILVNRGFIDDGEKLNIICCHGKTVAEASKEYKRSYNEYIYNINFINTEDRVMYSSKTILNNGLIRLNLYTNKNKLNEKLNQLRACF